MERMTEVQVRVETHGEPHGRLPGLPFPADGSGSTPTTAPTAPAVALGSELGDVQTASSPAPAAGASTDTGSATSAELVREHVPQGEAKGAHPRTELHQAHEQMVARGLGERGVVVEVDADLTLHVAMSDDGVEVLVEGTADALDPLRDMEDALRDGLESDGQELLDYTTRQRSEDDEEQQPSRRNRFLARQSKAKTRAPVGRGQLLNAVA